MGHKSIAGEHEELVAGKIVGMICEHFAIEILRTLVVDDSELFAKVEEALEALGGPEKAKHQVQIQIQADAMKERALAEQRAEVGFSFPVSDSGPFELSTLPYFWADFVMKTVGAIAASRA